ncbi:hypothetical protein MMC26_004772 [Xylographa opegraphella]|nr:hypothetical protein [Xylographa opegraphella]
MDDLAGLEWTPSSSSAASKPLPINNGNYYPALRPTPPISGRSTPALQTASISQAGASARSTVPSKTSTPANDSFANLLPFIPGTATSQTKNLPLQEQRRLLQEQKAKEVQERKDQLDGHFESTNKAAWDQLGSGSATPDRIIAPPSYTGTDEYGGQKLSAAINKPFASISKPFVAPRRQPSGVDGDLLAAFDADTPVDRSSDFPVSSDMADNDDVQLPATDQHGPKSSGIGAGSGNYSQGPDDDPFGLGVTAPANLANSLSSPQYDEDDVLGLLGRPVSDLQIPRLRESDHQDEAPPASSTPLDKAIAELVDMGFPAERSRQALESTESGLNVQAAVGLLLHQAHEESRMKSNTPEPRGRYSGNDVSRDQRLRPSGTISPEANSALPTWMQQQSRSNLIQRREDSRSPAFGDKDPAKIAAELGNNLLKTANSLWKTSTKKINQAVSDFNSDSDSTQPKWMRDTRPEQQNPRARQSPRQESNEVDKPSRQRIGPQSPPAKSSSSITDEALMLEARDVRPRPWEKAQTTKPDQDTVHPSGFPRNQSPTVSNAQIPTALPRFGQQQPMPQPRSRLGREEFADGNSQPYKSPARRRKAPPKATEPEPALLFGDTPQPPRQSQPKLPLAPQPRTLVATTLPSDPPAPTRKVITLSSIALQSSTAHRQAGTSAFKLGNYAEATAAYTLSLTALPPSHPLTIVLLTNRALTNLKTGDSKASLSDADSALALIGPSKGRSEAIDLGPSEGHKPMALYWGKAITRKAEALEQLERWTDALQAWKDCIAANVGGSISIQGRNRCEKAAGSGSNADPARPPPSKVRKPPSKPAPTRSALDDLSGRATLSSSAPSAEAVTRLRAANAQAERVDDEKFALADSVDERLNRWRKGKEGNLRALLGSLDTVLWEGAGWRKVGMSELIVPGKVKVAYMRGIAKVHPDKLPQNATTEQVMISGAVFSTLNEAWDRFKRENGL